MKAERIFQIIAVILVGIAAYFLWNGNSDGVFVSAVLGCVAFFLSIRFQVKERNAQRAAATESKSDDESEPPAVAADD